MQAERFVEAARFGDRDDGDADVIDARNQRAPPRPQETPEEPVRQGIRVDALGVAALDLAIQPGVALGFGEDAILEDRLDAQLELRAPALVELAARGEERTMPFDGGEQVADPLAARRYGAHDRR